MTSAEHSLKKSAREHGPRVAKYAGVGVLNTAMDFGLFLLLLSFGVAAVSANVVSFLTAVTQSYFLNAQITFRANGVGAPTSVGGYAKFIAANLVTLAVSSGFIILFANTLGNFGAKLASVAFTLLASYAANALFVFRRKPDGGAA